MRVLGMNLGRRSVGLWCDGYVVEKIRVNVESMCSYSRSLMPAAGISNLEKANIFLPRSFKEAPM